MTRRYDGLAARPAALLLSPEAPYPVIGGGATRTASVIEYLSQRYAVDVVVFREPGAGDPAGAFPDGLVREVRVFDLPYHAKHMAARAGRNCRRLLLGRPPLNDRFSGFARPLAAFLTGRRYEMALIEHFWCAPYVEQIAAHAPVVGLDLHNIESVLHGRSARTEPWPVSCVLRRFEAACAGLERRWLPRFHFVLAASDGDAARVRSAAPECSVYVYPNAIPCRAEPAVAERDEIAFSGNLEYQPNVQAVRFFRREVWPVLQRRRPGLVWRLIGKNPAAVRRYVEGDRCIQVSGLVEDAIGELAAAKVVVVPLLSGSGTRVKILEAWAAGRAVVSTAIGAEGLAARDGEHLLVAETAEAFAASVARLLDSPDLRRRLGRCGRALYEARFTWPRAWERLRAAGI